MYAGLGVEAAVDFIVAAAQCALLRRYQTGIRRCVRGRAGGVHCMERVR